MSVETKEEGKVVNDILEEIGVGWYQILSTFFIILPTILNFMSNNTFIFTSRDTSYRCFIPECEQIFTKYDQPWLSKAIPFEEGILDKCRRYVPQNNTTSEETSVGMCNLTEFNHKTTQTCDYWVFGKGESIVKSYNIPCKDWKRSIVQSANSAGLLVSLLTSGLLSDKYGRRTTIVFLMFTGSVMAIIQSFSTNYWMFLVFEFLNASIGAGGYSIAYVLLAESLPPSKRIYGCTLLEIMNTLCIAALGYLAWITPTWKILMRIVNFPILTVPLIVFVVPESIRWLYAKGKRKQCIKLYKRYANFKGSSVSDKNITELENVTITLLDAATQEDNKKSSFVEMFRSMRMLTRLFLCSFCWFANILSYNGLIINSFSISDNEDNDYLNFILVTLVELPSILIYFLLLKYLKRKVGLSTSFFSAGVLCIAYGVSTEWSEKLRFSIYLLGKLLINTCLASMYVYSSEIFPTVYRSSSMNFCYVFGSFGGMVTPQLLLLSKLHESLPMFIFGTMSILAAFSIARLPETKGKRIPDTLEEAEKL